MQPTTSPWDQWIALLDTAEGEEWDRIWQRTVNSICRLPPEFGDLKQTQLAALCDRLIGRHLEDVRRAATMFPSMMLKGWGINDIELVECFRLRAGYGTGGSFDHNAVLREIRTDIAAACVRNIYSSAHDLGGAELRHSLKRTVQNICFLTVVEYLNWLMGGNPAPR